MVIAPPEPPAEAPAAGTGPTVPPVGDELPATAGAPATTAEPVVPATPLELGGALVPPLAVVAGGLERPAAVLGGAAVVPPAAMPLVPLVPVAVGWFVVPGVDGSCEQANSTDPS